MSHPSRTHRRAARPGAPVRTHAVRPVLGVEAVLAAARDLLRSRAADTFVAVGGALVGVTGHGVRGGRFVATLDASWSWPNDEPDTVGEVVVTAADTCTAVQLVGWWSPVAGECSLVLDVSEARVRSGEDVLVLDADDAVELLLR